MTPRRQRPCSSCILANTQSQCYPDATSYQPPPSHLVTRALSKRGSQSHRILGAPMGRRGSSGLQLYEGPTAVDVTLAPLKDGVRHLFAFSRTARQLPFSLQRLHPPNCPLGVSASPIGQTKTWTYSADYRLAMFARKSLVNIALSLSAISRDSCKH